MKCWLGHTKQTSSCSSKRHTKRENEVLARTHEANIELQHQVDTLKHEFNNFRTNSTYYNLSSLQVPHGVWVFALDVLHTLNRAHSNFQGVFFDDFRALLGENDDAVYVRRMGNYIRLMQSMYMFVRAYHIYIIMYKTKNYVTTFKSYDIMAVH